MLRRQNECPQAFGGDPSLTHSLNLRSEYPGNISLNISGRGETSLQTGASSLNGETKIGPSSSNGDKGNSPSAASRSSFDSSSILENRDFGGGDTSLGDGVRAGPSGIAIGFGTNYLNGRKDKVKGQDDASSTAEHHRHQSSGHHTHSQRSDASPSQSAEGGEKSHSKDASGNGHKNHNNGDSGKSTSSRDRSSYNNNTSQTIPNPTPNPTNAPMRPTGTEIPILSKEPSPPITPISETSSRSTTDTPDIRIHVHSTASSESLPLSQPSFASAVGAGSHVSSTGGTPTTSLSTASTAMASPSRTENSISTSTNTRGLIGGIIGGIIAFSALLILLVFQFVRKRRRLRITSSLFNFDTEKFVGAKRSESDGEACVSTSETHLVSPPVVKWEPASGWGDDRCHDDGDKVFRPTRASRDEVINTTKDAGHARTSIISDPFADPNPVVEHHFHDPARESRHVCRDSETSSLAMSYEEGTVQEASRVPIRRLGSSVLSFDHDTFAIGPSVSDT